MLYILPPPTAANSPSPWNILCPPDDSNTEPNTERPPWSSNTPKNDNKRHLPRIRLRTARLNKINDESNGFVVGDEVDTNRNSKSLSECYFAGKGTALVLPAEAQKSSRQIETQGSNIQKHLQSMFYLLRPEETLKMAVKLESVHASRTRYLVVVSRMGRRAEESCLLGIDCNEKTTVGLVLRVLADTAITLDGDGGFSVAVCGRHHIFKPVSVQAMWSALQTLHRASSKAREENYFQGGLSHDWVDYYEQRIESDRSCLNEWHAMDDLESRRPPSPDSIRTKPSERAETEKIIRATLKEIMMSVDLDEVTSKYIRTRLEEELDMDLGEFKSFIDQEMLTILGQMDAPTEIFDHVYLGSEWNASNYEELKRNGVRHILNVTREIDNFFPGTFDYLNIRVYDDEKTDLLKYWDNTYKYISKAKKEGSKVLVHCKMGVSRSASVVIAYAMKAYNWDFKTAMRHVKEKRSCIKPNTSFIAQLETYQGILDAMKNKEKLQRSKSETNLKSPDDKYERLLPGSQPTPLLQAFSRSALLQTTLSGQDLIRMGARPKSWSPDNTCVTELLSKSVSPFRSLENLNKSLLIKDTLLKRHKSVSKLLQNERVRNVLLPCDNGESYSVSPNQIRHLPGQLQSSIENNAITVKQIVDEFESQTNHKDCRKKLVVTTPSHNSDSSCNSLNEEDTTQSKPNLSSALLAWDPGESEPGSCNLIDNACDCKCDEQKQTMWTSSTVLQNIEVRNSAVPFSNINQVPVYKTKTLRKDSDPFSNQLDRVFDREEKKQQRVSTIAPLPVVELESNDVSRDCPSRQSSWGSYDSAVVLGYQSETRDVPSRHSSWGSGDTRTLPSRNSSWGSYDMRPSGTVHYMNEKGEKVLHPSSAEISGGVFSFDKEEVPWHPGTVKRKKREGNAKQDGEEICDNEVVNVSYPVTVVSGNGVTVETFNLALIEGVENDESVNKNSSSAISSEIDIINSKKRNRNLLNSQLSVSAPESSAMDIFAPECSLSRSASNISSCGNVVLNAAQSFSVKQHKNFIESLGKEMTSLKRTSPNDEDHRTAGIVQNLKKEFEAITSGTNGEKVPAEIVQEENNSSKHKSLPTSPQCVHVEKNLSPTNSDPGSEDLSFKKLIGKFELGTKENQDSQVNLRQKQFYNKNHHNKNSRFSCIEMSSEKNSNRVAHTPLISSFNTKSKISTAENQSRRPPVAPVITKAALKQQQFGKSHPLARLNINKPRHNNPVYNTM